MAKMPLDPSISPRIELNIDPKTYLVRDEEAICPECDECYWIEEDAKDRVCVCCCIKKSGGTSIMMFGWQIMRSANQIITVPPRHRVS